MIANTCCYRKKTLAELPEGRIIKIYENGIPADFYVAKHDYESGLNGFGRTLVVRRECYDKRAWNSGEINAYGSSTIDRWLNGDYKALLDTDIQSAIGTTKFMYTPGDGNNTVGTLERAIFLLSVTELGETANKSNTEGSALDIASTLQSAYANGSTCVQWTRSPLTSNTRSAYYLGTDGGVGGSNCTSFYWSRPAFTLPSNISVSDGGTVVP